MHSALQRLERSLRQLYELRLEDGAGAGFTTFGLFTSVLCLQKCIAVPRRRQLAPYTAVYLFGSDDTVDLAHAAMLEYTPTMLARCR